MTRNETEKDASFRSKIELSSGVQRRA